MKILSVDPGSNGALVCLELNKVENKIYYTIDWTPMPTVEDNTSIDTLKAANWIRERSFDHIFIEHVHAIFGSAAGATFRFGRMFGGIEGVVGGLGLPYSLVPPKTWQKHVWIPELIPHKKDIMTAKEKSAKTVELYFPNIDLKPTKRSKNQHDGAIDSILIALYGFKQNKFDFGVVLPPYLCSLTTEGK